MRATYFEGATFEALACRPKPDLRGDGRGPVPIPTTKGDVSREVSSI